MPDLWIAVYSPIGLPRSAGVVCACGHLHHVQSLLSAAAFLAVPLVLTCFLAQLWHWQYPLPSCLKSAWSPGEWTVCALCLGGEAWRCGDVISSKLPFPPGLPNPVSVLVELGSSTSSPGQSK